MLPYVSYLDNRYWQRCALSFPRRRARAKNPKKAEESENAMREGLKSF